MRAYPFFRLGMAVIFGLRRACYPGQILLGRAD